MIEFSAGRPATRSSSGMVTSPHALASQAGAAVLRDGGTAVDGGVATSAALSVLYPDMPGIGGDAFWLIYDAAANAVRYIDGGGRATSRGTVEAFAPRGLTAGPPKGPAPRAGRRGGVGHGARRLWAAAAETLPGKRHRLRARRLSRNGAPRALAGGGGARSCQKDGSGGGSSPK